MDTSFGERLRAARVSKGLLQADVAKEIGCAPTSLTNWENGKVNPSMSVLSDLCRVYDIPPRALLSREYSYADIAKISEKPISERSYEEQVALTFSGDILNEKTRIELARKDVINVANSMEIANKFNAFKRFGSFTGKGLDLLNKENEKNLEILGEIAFAYNVLIPSAKYSFLCMLAGMLSDENMVTNYFKGSSGEEDTTMRKGIEYTINRFAEEKRKQMPDKIS